MEATPPPVPRKSPLRFLHDEHLTIDGDMPWTPPASPSHTRRDYLDEHYAQVYSSIDELVGMIEDHKLENLSSSDSDSASSTSVDACNENARNRKRRRASTATSFSTATGRIDTPARTSNTTRCSRATSTSSRSSIYSQCTLSSSSTRSSASSADCPSLTTASTLSTRSRQSQDSTPSFTAGSGTSLHSWKVTPGTERPASRKRPRGDEPFDAAVMTDDVFHLIAMLPPLQRGEADGLRGFRYEAFTAPNNLAVVPAKRGMSGAEHQDEAVHEGPLFPPHPAVRVQLAGRAARPLAQVGDTAQTGADRGQISRHAFAWPPRSSSLRFLRRRRRGLHIEERN